MKTIYYLVYLTTILWAIVPFRQFRKKYFFYFLTWASADIATLPARLIFHSGTNFFYAPFSFLALISLQDVKFIKKYRIVIIILFLAVCIISLNNNVTGIPDTQMFWISVSIIHFFILLIFLKELIIIFVEDNLVSLFLIILIFYEFTVLAKFLNNFTGFTNDYIYYVITSIFEILFALFFIIFKSDDKRLIFQLK